MRLDVTKTLKLTREASELLRLNNKRHGDMGHHASAAIVQYFEGMSEPVNQSPVKTKDVVKPKVFIPPDTSHVCQEMLNRGLTFAEAENESEKFCDFYESKGWMVGKNKMKSWPAAVRNWLKSYKEPKGYQTAREKSAARNADIFNYEKATTF